MDFLDNDGCFACGKANPMGLHLNFTEEGDEYVSYFTPRIEHQGWKGVVHGGLLGTVLDEVMVRRAHSSGMDAVTGELTVRYKKPTPVGRRLRFAARIESVEGRVIHMTANVADDDRTVFATAKGRIIIVRDK